MIKFSLMASLTLNTDEQYKGLFVNQAIPQRDGTTLRIIRVPEFFRNEVIEHVVYLNSEVPTDLNYVEDWKEFESRSLPRLDIGQRKRRTIGWSRWFGTIYPENIDNRGAIIENLVRKVAMMWVDTDSVVHEEFTGKALSDQYESAFNGSSKSCMTQDRGITDLWGTNPSSCRLCVLKDSSGFLARTLVYRPSTAKKICSEMGGPISSGWYYGRIYGRQDSPEAITVAERYLSDLGLKPVSSISSGWVMLRVPSSEMCPYVDRGGLCRDGDDVVWFHSEVPAQFRGWEDIDGGRTDGSGFGKCRCTCSCCEEYVHENDLNYVASYGDVCCSCLESDDFVYSDIAGEYMYADRARQIYAPGYEFHQDYVERGTRSICWRQTTYTLHEVEINDESQYTLEEFIHHTIGDDTIVDTDGYSQVEYVLSCPRGQLLISSSEDSSGKWCLNEDIVELSNGKKAGIFGSAINSDLFNGVVIDIDEEEMKINRITKNDRPLSLMFCGKDAVLVSSFSMMDTMIETGPSSLIGCLYYNHVPTAYMVYSFCNLGGGWSVSRPTVMPTDRGSQNVFGYIGHTCASHLIANFGYRPVIVGNEIYHVERVLTQLTGRTDQYYGYRVFDEKTNTAVDTVYIDGYHNIYICGNRGVPVRIYCSNRGAWLSNASELDMNNEENRNRYKHAVNNASRGTNQISNEDVQGVTY